MGAGVLQGQSFAMPPEQAARELARTMAVPGLNLVLLFFSPRYATQAFAQAAAQAFAPARVVGCTTSGEFGPLGCRADSVAAMGFTAPAFAAATLLLPALDRFQAAAIAAPVRGLFPRAAPPHRALITLIDGFSLKEELVVSALHSLAADVPLCGGSASDGSRLEQSWLLYDGRLHQNAALVLGLASAAPLHVFKTEHFRPGEQRLVVTAADSARRLVRELNGLPAAAEYARLTGTSPERLDLAHFAEHPLMVRVGGANFIRSCIGVASDGGLRFACAIDVGLVLRLGQGQDMACDIETALTEVERKVGGPADILGFDCLLRRQEMEHSGQMDPIGALMRRHRLLGFSTFGEQFQGMHINQTLTGIAFPRAGAPPR
ncbi:FIST N domain protein [mine drainage metagenome]|uniref:FIST N domain protein n=1 Tax=mine drainage metagenome TaxID=410659 RepID=A0A1J5S187_9ZZZZ